MLLTCSNNIHRILVFLFFFSQLRQPSFGTHHPKQTSVRNRWNFNKSYLFFFSLLLFIVIIVFSLFIHRCGVFLAAFFFVAKKKKRDLACRTQVGRRSCTCGFTRESFPVQVCNWEGCAYLLRVKQETNSRCSIIFLVFFFCCVCACAKRSRCLPDPVFYLFLTCVLYRDSVDFLFFFFFSDLSTLIFVSEPSTTTCHLLRPGVSFRA